MKKPPVVDVMGLLVRMSYNGENVDEAGHYDRTTKCIVISEEEKGQRYVRTVLHELGHALLDRSGVHQAISEELEEVIVEVYSNFLAETFKMDFL